MSDGQETEQQTPTSTAPRKRSRSKGIRTPWRPIVERVWDGSSPDECRAAFHAAYDILLNSPAARETIRLARAALAAERLEAEQAAGEQGQGAAGVAPDLPG